MTAVAFGLFLFPLFFALFRGRGLYEPHRTTSVAAEVNDVARVHVTFEEPKVTSRMNGRFAISFSRRTHSV